MSTARAGAPRCLSPSWCSSARGPGSTSSGSWPRQSGDASPPTSRSGGLQLSPSSRAPRSASGCWSRSSRNISPTAPRGTGLPLADVDLLWRHLSGLLLLADPWGTYHRQFDVGPHLLDPPYVAYRWAYLTLCLLVLAGLGTLALRRRRPANLVLAAFPALVLAAVVETEQAYEVHHIVNVKPALYVAASVLAAELARARRARAPVLATWAGLALGALWVDARAFTDL